MQRKMDWKEALIVAAAIQTGLFVELSKKPMSSNKIAQKLGLDKRAVEIVLEALNSLDYLNKEGEKYNLASQSWNLFINKQADEYCANSIMHNKRLISNWLKLDKAIYTGKSQTSARNTEELKHFVGTMDENSKKRVNEVVKIVLNEKKDAKSVLDLGGGSGIYSKAFAEKGINATVLETPAVVSLLKDKIKNVNVIDGDFHEKLPDEKFDVILMVNITHIYNAGKNTELFKKAKERLVKNGIIAIVDFIKGISENAEVFAVNMLINTVGGGTWTVKQYGEWAKEAGLEVTKVQELKTDVQVIILK